MADTPLPSFRTTLALLGPGPLRRYFLGESVSVVGTFMQTMALGWVMATLTDKSFLLGLVNFASGVPMLLLTMLGGSWADRFDKRLILMATQLAQIALAVTMGLLVLGGQISMWHIIALSALLGVSNAFDMPAVSALLPELVERHQIGGAIALDRLIFHVARFAGPALGGLVVGAWGAAVAFFVNAASFVPLMIALTTLGPRPACSEEEEQQRKSGIREGIAWVLSDRSTLAMIGLTAMTTLCVFPVLTIMMPLYVRYQLHADASAMGWLMAIAGAGSVLGTLWLFKVPPAKRWVAMVFSAAGTALGLGGLVPAGTMPQAAPFVLLMASSLSTLVGLANTTIQERAPGVLRGRVSAIAGISFFGLMPIAGLGITALADGIGMRSALTLGTALFLIGAGGMLVGPARSIATLELQPTR